MPILIVSVTDCSQDLIYYGDVYTTAPAHQTDTQTLSLLIILRTDVKYKFWSEAEQMMWDLKWSIYNIEPGPAMLDRFTWHGLACH